MIDRLISGLIALSLAFLVWLYARGREQESLDNVPIPVQLALAPGQEEHYDLEITGPSQVVVSFTGPPSRIYELRGMLQRGEVRVAITLAIPEDRQNESRFLDTVLVDAADVHTPPGVTAVVLEGRNRIPVTLRRLVEQRLPVRFDHAPDDDIGKVTVDPATVLVRGPQEILDQLRAIPTQHYTLPQRADETVNQEVASVIRLPLVQELEGRAIRASPAMVTVHLTLKPRQKVYELADIPVHFLCPANFGLRPCFDDERAAKIKLRILGPASETAPVVTAYIDLSQGEFKPGMYADEPIRLQLPQDFQLAQEPPRSLGFLLIPAEIVPKERSSH